MNEKWTKDKIFGELFSFSSKTIYNWERQKRPIVTLIKQYFSKEELVEFLETDKINKFELIKDLSEDKIKSLIKNEHNKKILEQIEELKKQLV